MSAAEGGKFFRVFGLLLRPIKIFAGAHRKIIISAFGGKKF
jgi:hypothetical protein